MGLAGAIPFFNEFAQAQQAERKSGRANARRTNTAAVEAWDPDIVRITSNENPMGPSKEGIEAMARVGPLGWRYNPRGENLEFDSLLQSTENVKPGYVHGYPGSSVQLANCAPAFTSPTRRVG